ncbi:9540_t:CDS:2, partial [Diversispora eburnea]
RLSIWFRNPEFFKKDAKLRKGESVKVSRVIVSKNDSRDPNYLKISMACGQIEKWCTNNLPDLDNYQSSTSKLPSNTKTSFTDLASQKNNMLLFVGFILLAFTTYLLYFCNWEYLHDNVLDILNRFNILNTE